MLLGRATILIKGIAKRLGIRWSLADKWKEMAEMALECGVDGCRMPTWSAPPSASQLEVASGGKAERLRFREVLSSYGGSGAMLGSWAKAKGGAVLGKVVPSAVKRAAVRVAARAAEK